MTAVFYVVLLIELAVLVSSLLFTEVAFPRYFDELREVQTQMLRAAGNSDAEIAARVETASRFQTPWHQALFGFLGTVATGFAGNLIIGAFIRKK